MLKAGLDLDNKLRFPQRTRCTLLAYDAHLPRYPSAVAQALLPLLVGVVPDAKSNGLLPVRPFIRARV